MRKVLAQVILILSFCNFFAQVAPNFQWAKNVGGPNYDLARGICMDASGNVYCAGQFTGTLDFDPGPGVYTITSTNGNSTYVLKLDASGNFIWVKDFQNLSSGANSLPYDITTNNIGDVLLTGTYSGTVDIDPGTSTFSISGGGMYVCKLDGNGGFIWGKAFVAATGGGGIPYDITLDLSSNIYITGRSHGQVDFDPGPGVSHLNFVNVFICKLDPGGNLIWRRGFEALSTNDNTSAGKSSKVDSAGNVFTTGLFHDWLDLDPGPGTNWLQHQGYSDIFVSKLNSSGNLCWAVDIGGPGFSSFSEGTDISIATNPIELVVGGYFSKTVDFDPGPATHTLSSVIPGTDGFISKYDTSGNFIWVENYANASVNSLLLDNSDNILLVGRFNAVTDLDPSPGTFSLPTSGTDDMFISKLDEDGFLMWVGSIGTSTQEIIYEICANGNNEIATLGQFSSNGDFDPTAGTYSLTSNGGFDNFIVRLGNPVTTSLASNTNKNKMSVRPNPFNDRLFIEGVKNCYIMLSDLTGRQVCAKKLEQDRSFIDLSELSAGIYLLHITGPDGISLTQKIIKE